MRLLLSSFLLIFMGGVALAQKSAYLKAEGGWGKTTVHSRNFFGIDKWEPVGTYRASILGGVKKRNFSLEIGFGYGRTGGRKGGLLFEPGTDPLTGQMTNFGKGDYSFLHHHITLPVSLGYDVKINKRWSVQPRLGLEGAYNAGAFSTLKMNGQMDAVIVNKENYRQQYSKYALFGSGALRFHYRVQPSLEIYGGPSYRQTLTNMLNTPGNTRYRAKESTLTPTIDLGVLHYFNRPSSGSQSSAPQE